ncbi:MAG: chemotaxis protein CheR [Treponema sp.]|jgi:chemotaxis protein methyltransferase CheR|nr:chemotaxis protein CheR [Treponema sp.]
MVLNTAVVLPDEVPVEISAEVLSSPSLLFLYYRIEHILGIRARSEALQNLNKYLEKTCGSSFIEDPASYEKLLTSREQIFKISKFLTVSETYFFREGEHFELLTELMPRFAELNRPVQICSAAVSSGCEAYSIAMLFDYYSRNGLNIDFSIDAFDVNLEAIETARKARYTLNTIRDNSANWRHILYSYLIQDKDEYVISPSIQSKIRFFPHNIMRGLEKQYDIIFFRNSLIYFSTKNRFNVINNLADSLYNNGLLFLGISETSSVKHPLLLNCCSSKTFYFKKINSALSLPVPEWNPINIPAQKSYNKSIFNANKTYEEKREYSQTDPIHTKSSPAQTLKHTRLLINLNEINVIIKHEEGKQNAENVLDTLNNGDTNSISGSCFAAAALYYLHNQYFDIANMILTLLEKSNSGAYTKFLRGEYYFMLKQGEEALNCFHEAAVKNKFFWPAYYRIVSLSAESNRTSYEYKIKKAIESIELSQTDKQINKDNYECFMGGFSPDYFLRILKKKLTLKQEVKNES